MRCSPLTTMILAAVLLSLAAGRGHAEQAAETNDQAAIQGIWEALWSEDGGRRMPHGLVEHLRFFFSADTLRMRMGEKTVAESAYMLDPNQEPKVLDLVTRTGKEIVLSS